ncbi:ester cyclase [Echinicola jeungdonensis]|uniref:Ester cyclase n=1 Tax=Echinicola jeungdonensis TaxID=709343 RepID=A0ABV5J6W2_9BACT|nr:ester cyclase [Echinicola jeungdonensis]MDN3668645.1 ester cyclase [Echinicola jeungdonensis]
MNTTDYKQLIRDSYQVFTSGDVSVLDTYFNRDVVNHTPDHNVPSVKKGIDYFKEQLSFYFSAFSNMSVDIKEILGEGDTVISYVTVKGKHTGELLGTPPTNREINVDLCEMFKFRNGKISEYWGVFDNLAFLMQLGVITEEDLHKKGGALI